MQARRDGEPEEGWDSFSDCSSQDPPLPSLYHGKARPILQHQYSLEPDMATGWVPKLPSAPIPLTYQNPRIQRLLAHLASVSPTPIIYRGPRPINSVQLHQAHAYPWRHR
jgi:hypothetical protein